MRRKIHFLLFLFLCMASIPLAAQDIEVKGVVTEATTNEPLPGVTVRVKDKDTGTITDIFIYISTFSISIFSKTFYITSSVYLLA